MSTVLEQIEREVVDLHQFFTLWFNGTVDPAELDKTLLPRLHPDFTFISPDGAVLTRDHLANGFRTSHGSNRNFRIQVRDVAVRHVMGNHVLATYTEWQTGSVQSSHANNARLSTTLVDVGEPMTWLHLQETWLPDAVRVAGSFDF